LVGIKDSGGNIEISRSFKNAKDSFQVYIGSDSLAYEALRGGFDGTVAGGGNAIPEFPIAIYNSYVQGEEDSARRIQDIFNVWNSFRKNIQLSEITTTKIALSSRIKSFPINTRPPLMTGQPSEISSICSFMHEKALPSINSLG
jgi:dihydrodipicolinate synthase/N-acetylneuraminate lyase